MRSRYFLLAITLGLFGAITILLFLPLAASVAHADGAIFYVRPGGIGDCLSTTTPCGSIQQAIDLALAPDDQVLVAAGTYTEHLTIDHNVSIYGEGWEHTIINGNSSAPAPTIFISGVSPSTIISGVRISPRPLYGALILFSFKS